MKSFRFLPVLLLLSAPLISKAQNVFERHPPEGENVRLAWAIDADGGTNGDDFSGFEVAYASEMYPLDQMGISYAYANPDGSAMHTLMLFLEEFYPITESFKFYGVAGVGYMWTDYANGVSGDSTGWVGKLGAGMVYDLTDAFDLYAELAYLASDRDLWLDGDNAVDSENWNALLGFRFKY